MPASYQMHFRRESMEDMERLRILCALLRDKGVCFYITDIEIRGKAGYEVFWYIKPEGRKTRFGRPDRRRR